MNRGKLIAIILILVGVVVTLLVIMPSNNTNSWYASYEPEDREPYGGYALYHMLKAHKGEDFVDVRDTIYHVMDSIGYTGPATYMYYGNALYTDSAELVWLLDFVDQGNTAFISSKRFNWGLFDTLFYQSEPTFWLEEQEPVWNVFDYLNSVQDTSIFVEREPDNQEFKWVRHNHVLRHDWTYFYDTELAGNEYPENLGQFETTYGYGYVNLIRVPFGEGEIYLHTTPEAFTNYHLREPGGFAYLQDIVQLLPEGTLIWDEINRTYTYSDTPSQRDPRTEEGPLTFIQSQPALQAALYSLLLFILLYILLGLRRTQRPIPVLESRANTSIEFSEVVSQLYLNQRDHRKLGLLKMRLFQAFVLERYGIRATGKEPEQMQAYGKRIATKSNIAPQHLKELMDTYRELTVIFNVDNALLVRFHKQLEYFYQNCK